MLLIFREFRHIDEKEIKVDYYTYVKAPFNYGLIVWAGTLKSII